MKLLLDTHIWLWFLMGSRELPPHLKKILETKGTELWLSPISLWEVMMLAEKGRIELTMKPSDWIRKAWEGSLYHEAPLNAAVAIRSRELPFSHPDPADRFLAATALIYELRMVTCDKVLLNADWLPKIL